MRIAFQYIVIPSIVITIMSLLIINNPPKRNSFLRGLEIKHQRLNHTTGKRIIINGGSNLAFGIQSDLMEQKLNKPVVNLGIMAGLGLEFMVNQVLENAKTHDTVILIPEYALYKFPESSSNNPILLSCLEVFPEAKKYIPNYSLISGLMFKIQSSLYKRVQSFDSEEDNKTYNFKAFNSYGDVYTNKGVMVTKQTLNDYEFPIDLGNRLELEKVQSTFSYLEKIDSILGEKQIEFFISFPPAPNNHSMLKNAPIFYQLISKTNLTLLGKPEDFLLEHKSFYNGPAHLNNLGAQKRTLLLTQFLENVFYFVDG